MEVGIMQIQCGTKGQDKYLRPGIELTIHEFFRGYDMSRYGAVRAEITGLHEGKSLMIRNSLLDIIEAEIVCGVPTSLTADVWTRNGHQIARVRFFAKRDQRGFEMLVREILLSSSAGTPSKEEVLENELSQLQVAQMQAREHMRACEQALEAARREWQQANLAVAKKRKEIDDLFNPKQ